MKVFHTPEGKPVRGILQRLHCIRHATSTNEAGVPNYGDVLIWWDEAEDVFDENPEKSGIEERVWVDHEGECWFESQLTLVEVPA